MGEFRQAAIEAWRFIDDHRDGDLWHPDDRDSSTADLTFYRGACGIILFGLELAAVNDDAELRSRVVSGGRSFANRLEGIHRSPVSIEVGFGGMFTALVALAETAGLPGGLTTDEAGSVRSLATALVERLYACAEPLGSGIGWIEEMPFSEITGMTGRRELIDLTVGAAGAVAALLWAAEHDLHPQALGWALLAGDRLMEVAERTDDGLRWNMMVDMPFPFTAPNFSHGSAGVAWALARLYQATGDQRYLQAAIDGARYALAQATEVGDGMLICHTEEQQPAQFYAGLCHGPPGTARTMLLLGELTGASTWTNAGHRLMSGLDGISAPEQRSWGLWNNHGQCCGDAGIGEFALHLADLDPSRAAGYLDLATRCGRVILDASTTAGTGESRRRWWVQAEHRAHPSFLQAQTGYMQGAAGIGSFLLHLDAATAGRRVDDFAVRPVDWPSMRV